ncbi:MAG: serine hydrolase domain-containing protein [Acidobacteriota bacterium]
MNCPCWQWRIDQTEGQRTKDEVQRLVPRPSSIVLSPLYFVLVICLLCQPGNAAGGSDKVDTYISQQMAKHQIPGLSLAVVKNGKVLKLKGYGVSSIELGVPADENSVFQIYSTTKIFAGVAILKLVEDGKLTLDTAVTDIIETLPPAWKAIRVRHLLTHTSGLPEKQDNPRFAGLSDEKKKETPPEEWIPLVAEMPLKFHAGEKLSYHRSGYSLLGVIVERLAGMTFAAFLEARVFAPLQMSSTRFGDSEVIVKGHPPTAYFRGDGELRHWVYAFGYGNPGTGLNSSAADLVLLFINTLT